MIKILNENTNYWLVRTASGAFYDQFVAGNYIAVGWNEISDIEILKGSKEDEAQKEDILKTIRELVDKEEENQVNPKGERERETQKSRIYNQINRFVNEMAVGDYVLIPSQGSNLIEFGIITSDAYIYKKEVIDMDEGECDFIKRRDISWICREKRNKLDPYLFGLLYSQHAISSANDYAHFIDRTINRFFIKGNQAHIVLEVNRESDIYGMDLIKLVNSTLGMVDSFNKFAESNLNKDHVQIKINVQSPGVIELFGHIDEIVIIALVMTILIGGKVSLFKMITLETPGLIEKVRQFIEMHQKHGLDKEKIELEKKEKEFQQSINSLQIKIPPELQGSNQEEMVEENKA